MVGFLFGLVVAMRVSFAMFDKDGDGRISEQEVHESMTSLGVKINIKEVKEIVKRVDIDRKSRLLQSVCWSQLSLGSPDMKF